MFKGLTFGLQITNVSKWYKQTEITDLNINLHRHQMNSRIIKKNIKRKLKQWWVYNSIYISKTNNSCCHLIMWYYFFGVEANLCNYQEGGGLTRHISCMFQSRTRMFNVICRDIVLMFNVKVRCYCLVCWYWWTLLFKLFFL